VKERQVIKKACIIINCLTILFVAGCFYRTGSVPKIAGDQNDTYIFVQLTDNHLGLDPKCSVISEKLIEEINKYKAQKPIEFIAFTGDLFNNLKDDSVLEDYKSIRKKSSYSIYVVAGNHEFDLDTGNQTDKETVNKYAAKWKENFGEFNYCIDVKKVRFIFVSTESIANGVNIEGCEVYQWLEAKLIEARSSSRDIIIFTHRPVVKDYYEGRWVSPYPDEVYERLGNLINKYHVNAVVAGHFHMDDLFTTGNVPVYVCPASVNLPCGSGRFRVYEYNARTKHLNYMTFEVR
jgi:predicted MPP superfamily phosphohydrolase